MNREQRAENTFTRRSKIYSFFNIDNKLLSSFLSLPKFFQHIETGELDVFDNTSCCTKEHCSALVNCETRNICSRILEAVGS